MTAFGSYVRSALDAYIEAQERKAQRYINEYVRNHPELRRPD